MPDLSYAQLKGTWLAAAKGTRYDTNAWATLMAAIAEAESSGDPTATNPTDNGGTQTSWGLWQISLGNHDAPSPNWADPETNARLAIGKLDSQGLTAWGTYNSGAYKGFLSGKTTADTQLVAGPDAVTTASLTAAGTAQANCAWSVGGLNLHNIGLGPIHGPTFSGLCILTKSEVRALVGGAVLVAGAFVMMAGLGLLLIEAGLKAGSTLAGPAARVGALTRSGAALAA